MDAQPRGRPRNIYAVSVADLPPAAHSAMVLPTDLPTLIRDLRRLLLDRSSKNNQLDSDITEYIESIVAQIQQLQNLSEPIQVFDALQSTLKLYMSDLLSINQCASILSNDLFHQILQAMESVEETLELSAVFNETPLYARTVCYRSFELLSQPVITEFLSGQSPTELIPHIAAVLCQILTTIQSTFGTVVFKKNDFQDQVPVLRQLMDYVERNKQNSTPEWVPFTINAILTFLWNLADETIVVPNLLEAKCQSFIMKWLSITDLPLNIQLPCIHILHNIARHEKGVRALNEESCISLLKEFKRRVIDPNKDKSDDVYEELKLVYCMTLSLLTEPKESREDLNDLRPILDQLMQLAVTTGQSSSDREEGFHVSEPIVVLTKLCVHDEILKYIMNEAPVKGMEAKSKVDFFCQLLIKFRGALASDNEADQLTLVALFNILWSISFHDEYVNELRSDTKFLMTVKTLAVDEGESLVEQYVPKHMSSIVKAASGILWNLDEDNPARAVRAESTADIQKKVADNGPKSNQTKVMVSYCHADSTFCHELVDALRKDSRFEVWVDFAYLHTDDFWEEIGEAIEKSEVVLFLMSKEYQNSKSCRQEVMYAKDSLNKRFIPVFVQKDFVPTGWLGVRIVGPQHVRFGKRAFDETIKELSKIIMDDKKTSEPAAEKPPAPPTVPDTKPIPPTDPPKKPVEVPSNHNVAEEVPFEGPIGKIPDKPVKKWTKADISQWFSANQIRKELADLYSFANGHDLLLYGQCLRPDWQSEYSDVRERYQQKYQKPLYRDQFVRLVSAMIQLESTSSPTSHHNSKLCLIS